MSEIAKKMRLERTDRQNSQRIELWNAHRARRWFKLYPNYDTWQARSAHKGAGVVNSVALVRGDVWVWVLQTQLGRMVVGRTQNMGLRLEELTRRPSGMPRGGKVVWLKACKVDSVAEAHEVVKRFAKKWKLGKPKPPRIATVEIPAMPDFSEGEDGLRGSE